MTSSILGIPFEGDVVEAICHYQTILLQADARIDRYFARIDADENSYRTMGERYHITESAARDPARCPADKLKRMKEAFELSRVEEYNAFFAPWQQLIELLHEARRHTKLSGTAEELLQRIRVGAELLDNVADRRATLVDKLSTLQEDVIALVHVNNIVLRRGVNARWAQSFSDPDDMFHMPNRKGEEWQMFRAWIWSLPETQRAVQAGRSVDEIAAETLYKDDESMVRE
ncbi:hypothetical protein BU26DRAFT_502478 [Trematosphaeria pertusa]|uniref:Uncharacterized protein n=1 Tax=Trematosphaeria pertusa TaxID=390896 RepID=A0A6A6INV7_9PLEO|nr:uncharacterized protein BU26DRAFT_502478 [Trematosphaeria pertusa]KAF2251907.1 hypothetical protein BU26DRAFT_502478 [Trematosphaeria pertusa]